MPPCRHGVRRRGHRSRLPGRRVPTGNPTALPRANRAIPRPGPRRRGANPQSCGCRIGELAVCRAQAPRSLHRRATASVDWHVLALGRSRCAIRRTGRTGRTGRTAAPPHRRTAAPAVNSSSWTCLSRLGRSRPCTLNASTSSLRARIRPTPAVSQPKEDISVSPCADISTSTLHRFLPLTLIPPPPFRYVGWLCIRILYP
jgi:hypothetical protein